MAVWKQLPYEFFEVDAVEAWLDEQVSQGLSLKKIRGSICRFERTSAGMTRYRVNILPTYDSPQSEKERIAAYREMGWEYVTPLTGKAEIYRALSPDAAELNTDEEVLDDALRTLLRSQLIRGISLTISILIIMVSNFWAILCGGIYRYFLYYGIWAPVLSALEILVLSLTIIFSVRPAIAVRKRELLARDYHTPSVFAHRRRRSRILSVLTAVMLVCLVLMIHNDKTYDMDPADCHPLVTLEDFCPKAAEKATVDAHRIASSTENTINYQQIGPSVLIPDETTQNYYASAFYYSIDTSIICWQTLAVNYALEHTKDWDPVEVSGYDKAWYHTYEYELTPERNTNCQQLVLLKGNEIIEINYEVNDPLYAADLRDGIAVLER